MLLDVQQLGKYYIFLSLFMLATLSIINPLGQYVNRFTYMWKINGHLLLWMKRYVAFIVMFSLLFSVGYIVRLYLLDDVDKLVPAFTCFLYITAVSINQFFLHSLNILDKRKEFSILTLFTAFFSLVFAYILLNLHLKAVEDVYLWLFGIVFANFLSMVISWFILNKDEYNANKTDPVKIKPILNFCLPIAFSTFFMWILNSGYRFGVEHIMGIGYLGVMAVCFSVSSQIMSVVESLVTQILQPTLFKKIDIKDEKKRINHLKIYINDCIAIYFSIFVFSAFFMHYIFLFLIDKKYLVYTPIGVVAICSEFFRVSTNACAMIFFGEKDMKRNIYPYAIGSLVLMVGFFSFSIFKITEYLFLIIPMIILLSSFVVFISCLFYIKKYGDLNIDMLFIFKRLLVVSPAIVIAFMIPHSDLIDLKQFIFVGTVSLLYGVLLVLSMLFVKQNRVNYES